MMVRPILLALALVGATEYASGDDGDEIFPADAKLELLFQRTAPLTSGLTEGPAVGPDGRIYFADLPLGPSEQSMIHCFDPRAQRTSVVTDAAGKTCGMAFDGDGHLLLCDGADGGGRCISRLDLATGATTIVADRYQGKRFNSPNDVCVDRQGRLYITDPRYLGDEPRELDQCAVYRIDVDGSVVKVTDDVEVPNGIALSPDERTLYIGDHNTGGNPITPGDHPPQRGAMRVYAFPLNADGLATGARRTLVDFGKENGSDGILVDAAGHVYISCRSLAKPGVLVTDPDGRELAFLATGPENQTGQFDDWQGIPSNMEFGVGDDAHTLYITMDKAFYRIRSKQRGIPPVWENPKSKDVNETN